MKTEKERQVAYGRVREAVGEEPNNKTQESLVVYKSFNTLRRKPISLTNHT
jgi:hypothetical protein